ncbi:MAG: protein kinase, partial [Planctomycetota bacterium]
RAHAHGVDEEGPFLVLDLLPGPSLAEVLARDGTLPEERVRRIGARLADALAALADLGYLHNDLKPENVLLDDRDRAVLIDLGLSVRRGARTVETAGSLAYFAPERLHGGVADSASDVFALGVLLYEIATGEHPFVPPGAEPAASIAAIERARCDLPSRRAPGLSPLFDELLSELLAPRPGERPRAREIAQRLRAGEGSAWWRRRQREQDGARWGIGERSRLVGRDAELDELMRHWTRVHASTDTAPRSGLALLTGSAGTGKVRLAGEFAVRARREGRPPQYLFARWSPAAASRPAGALSAWFERWAQRRPDGSLHPDRAADLASWLPPRTARTLVDGEHAEGSGIASVVEWLIALGRHSATILFLDNIHAAERQTLGALFQLFPRLEETRLFLVLSGRLDIAAAEPELFGRLIEILRDEARSRELQADVLRIDLPPLSQEAIRTLVQERFHKSAPRLRLAEVLGHRSQGNPGMFTELVAGLVRRGEAVPVSNEDPSLLLRIPVDRIPHPPSLERLLAERLTSLADRERLWLERASVVGGRITAAFLTQSYGPVPAGELDAVLGRLVETEWLVPAGARYRFTRPALREAIYRSLPAGRRRLLHLAAAAGLAEEGNDQELRYQRAFHLRAACSWSELVDQCRALAHELRGRSSSRRLLSLARWGIEALDAQAGIDEAPRRRLEFLELAADACDRLGLRDEQRALLDDLAAIEERGGGSDLTARVYLLHARYNVATGAFELATGLLRNAIRYATEVDDNRVASEAMRRLAEVHAQVGDLTAAREEGERALLVAATTGQEALAHSVLAMIDVLEDQYEPALVRVEAALAHARAGALGDVAPRAWMIAARAWRGLGRPFRALAAAKRASRTARAAGERRLEVEARARLGGLLLDLDRADEAEAQLRDAQLLAEEISDRAGRTLALVWLGVLLWEAGDSEAEATIVRALDAARELGFWRAEGVALAFLARIATLGPNIDLARALETSERALELTDQHGAEITDAVTVAGTRVLVLERAGRQREAQALSSRVTARIQRSALRIQSASLARSHREYLERLFASVRSTEGHVWPRRG